MLPTDVDTAVVGGGAAGFFAAIHAASAEKRLVVILEKSSKLLTKVKVSGGGRCNVTHDCDNASALVSHYPRGGKSLRKGFEQFGTRETFAWFESRGIKLKTEEDGRIFPLSDNSQTIIDCLLTEVEKKKVDIRIRTEVVKLLPQENHFELKLKNGDSLTARKVIVTTGGHHKAEAYQWLAELGLTIAKPIPSLFTFNVPDCDVKDLQGLSVKEGSVQIPGSKWKQHGPILITHWGFSAPAVIKLSAWAAIDFYDKNYRFPLLINWTSLEENQLREELSAFQKAHPRKKVSSNQMFDIPLRLWQRLCEMAGINTEQRYLDLPRKQLNRLSELLVRSPYQVNGKTTFKEEFVTCGGVELSEVNLKTFECRRISGLYLAGEVLNVDGLTGGFNFQHAWTSGYLAGNSAAETKASEI